MPRRRNISPNLTANEYLANASIPARFLFAMLPCWADCEGRLKERPKQIKRAVFPWDDIEVGAILDELENLVDDDGRPADFIRRYRDGSGQKVIQIVHFLDHQKPHRNEIPSVLGPPQDRPCTDQGQTEDVPRTDLGRTKDSTARADPNPDPNPDPDPKPRSPSRAGNISTKDAMKSLGKCIDAEPGTVFARRAIVAAECSEAWIPWFTWVGAALEIKGAHSELADMLKNMMDAKDPETRQAKGVGELHTPIAFIKSRLPMIMKANGIRKWPDWPE